MITVSMISFTGLEQKFICNVRDDEIFFIWINSKGFRFNKKVNRFEIQVYNKGIKRKLVVFGGCFKCRRGRG